MNFSIYRQIYQRFGASALASSAAAALVGKVLESQLLVVYVLDGQEIPALPEGLEVRVLSESELSTYAGREGLDLPPRFVREATANGDECVGAFLDGDLCGYAWYALRPTNFSSGLTARCDSRFVYAYKNLTLPAARGRSVQKWVKRWAVQHYRRAGRDGVLVAIDATNYPSRRSTEGAGARRVGNFAWWRRSGAFGSRSSAGAKQYGFRMYPTPDPPTGQAALRVQVVENLAGLSDVHAEWARVLSAQPRGNGLFYERWWLEAVSVRYETRARRPHFILFWEGSRLVGFLPAMLERKGASGGFVRRLYFWGGVSGPLNNMAPDLVVADPIDSARCVRALHSYLFGFGSRTWDLLELPYVSAESAALEPLQLRFRPSVRKEPMKVFIVDLPNTFEAYRATLDRRTFSEVRRRRRRLTEQGIEVELQVIPRLSESQLTEVMRIHSTRQEALRAQGHSRHAVFDTTEDRATMLRLLEAGAQAGMTRHYLLTIGGEIAAFFLCFAHGGGLHLFVTAFDEKFAAHGPTKMLFLDIVQSEIERYGSRLLNLSAGEGRWKDEFTDHAIENYHLSAENPALASRVRLLLWRLPRRLLKAARRG